jgi:Tfp pilus assembly protein PilP
MTTPAMTTPAMTTLPGIVCALLAVLLTSSPVSAGLPLGQAPSASQAPAPSGDAVAAPDTPDGTDGVPVAADNSSDSVSADAVPATGADGASPQDPGGFTYNAEGRRDPFTSLVGQGAGAGVGARPAGLAGLAVAEVTLRGTMTSRDGIVAMVRGVDQKTYIVRAGDTLLDGVVQSISLDDMVIVQEVNDPLSLESQREVRKFLRQAEAN